MHFLFFLALFIYFPSGSLTSDDIAYLLRIPMIEKSASKPDRSTGTSAKGKNRDGWMIRIGTACANHVDDGI